MIFMYSRHMYVCLPLLNCCYFFCNTTGNSLCTVRHSVLVVLQQDSPKAPISNDLRLWKDNRLNMTQLGCFELRLLEHSMPRHPAALPLCTTAAAAAMFAVAASTPGRQAILRVFQALSERAAARSARLALELDASYGASTQEPALMWGGAQPATSRIHTGNRMHILSKSKLLQWSFAPPLTQAVCCLWWPRWHGSRSWQSRQQQRLHGACGHVMQLEQQQQQQQRQHHKQPALHRQQRCLAQQYRLQRKQ